MTKKKVKENKRAKAGSGVKHDKHAPTEVADDAPERAEAGSGEQHDKHAPTDTPEQAEETESE